MAKNKKKEKSMQTNQNEVNLQRGMALVNSHSLFGDLKSCLLPCTEEQTGRDNSALADNMGRIFLNKQMRHTPEQWAYIIAHCQLHLAFGHFNKDNLPGYIIENVDGTSTKKIHFNKQLWNMACDIYITRFLYDIKFGEPIHANPTGIINCNLGSEQTIYDYLEAQRTPFTENFFGTTQAGQLDIHGLEKPIQNNLFTSYFSDALTHSVSLAVSNAVGSESKPRRKSAAMKAAEWFINSYPLLGGLAAHFQIIEDSRLCIQQEIQVAAINIVDKEIYLNPAAGCSQEEWKFILAHEYLHAGLQHYERCQGRNSYLWNVACDFVINNWLTEMNIGSKPENGILYDESLAGLSAEAIYDTMVRDIKKYSKLHTLRGYSKGDIIGTDGRFHGSSKNVTLDEFCKNALMQGLEYHTTRGRGLIPQGLIEEIRALSMPPIPWNVQLANWFDTWIPSLEKHRTYARPSRRQSATPDIPRPRYITEDLSVDSRTFGVVIDTSGSMSPKEIGMALGSIASYAASREVPFARVVFCDAAAYDAGYLSPEDIAGRVAVKGRGGTKLQPAIDLLEQAKDFPKKGPVLIITDGGIENKMQIKQEHAWLLPRGCYLPFHTGKPVFHFEE